MKSTAEYVCSNYDRLCTCGHTLEDHHSSYFPGGGAMVEECEYYGSNELGGMMPDSNPRLAATAWVDHCHSFRQAEED